MRRLLLFAALSLCCNFIITDLTAVYAQNYQSIQKELREQQEKARSNIQTLRRQIIGFEDQISTTTDEYTHNFEQFQSLQREIALRNAVIRSMEEERASILEELRVTQKQIDDLTKDLNTIIENYQSTLTYLYKSGRIPDEVILLSASSINQMLVRSYYLQRFEEHRQKQARQITELQNELKVRETELVDARKRNKANIVETEKEHRELEKRRRLLEQQVAELRRDRERLEQRLNATRREAENLESTLSELIEEESRIRAAEQNRLERLEQERLRRLANAENIRNRRERDAQIARYTEPVHSSGLPTDEQLLELESSFEELKGELPWPVTSGAISVRFGNRVNPVYGTSIDNPGIEIATEPRSDVLSVHDGYVFSVQAIPGYGNCIFVKHGKYITVYGNMSNVSVSRGVYVNKGDIMGQAGDEDSLKGNALFFMIREQNTNLDPEIWITSK